MGTRAAVFAAMRPPRSLLFVAFVFFVDCLPAARAEEPFFKKGDVIAIVGGEDMVALSEYGYLELLLTRALPDYHLRFRNLAWEGDTVFEQRRDLGFPTWEEQLEKIGATVVLCQFGQMESLAGKEKLPEFIAAYEKLIARLSGGGKRRVAVVTPFVDVPEFFHREGPIHHMMSRARNMVKAPDVAAQQRRDKLADASIPYGNEIHMLAYERKWHAVALVSEIDRMRDDSQRTEGYPVLARDGIHLNERGHRLAGLTIATQLYSPLKEMAVSAVLSKTAGSNETELLPLEPLRQLIIAKNRLWFDYWRVQNWAFLAGDRTNQPSSRDHLDPAKRWFPEERERFIPLIEAREKEIDALAAKLTQP